MTEQQLGTDVSYIKYEQNEAAYWHQCARANMQYAETCEAAGMSRAADSYKREAIACQQEAARYSRLVVMVLAD